MSPLFTKTFLTLSGLALLDVVVQGVGPPDQAEAGQFSLCRITFYICSREERSSGRDYERSERSERSSRSESSSTPAERKLTPPIPEPFGEDEHAQDAGKTKDQLEDGLEGI